MSLATLLFALKVERVFWISLGSHLWVKILWIIVIFDLETPNFINFSNHHFEFTTIAVAFLRDLIDWFDKLFPARTVPIITKSGQFLLILLIP